MVRRWSYLNSVNSFYGKDLVTAEKSFFDVNTNTTMYLRKLYTLSTRLTRKQWSRRKHIFNLLPISNVLKDWSRSYRFYRNCNKLVLMQFFTKNTFLAFNLTGLRNVFPGLHKGSGHFLTGSFSKKMGVYYSRFPQNRFTSLQSLRNSNTLYVSCINDPTLFNLAESPNFFRPLAVTPLLSSSLPSSNFSTSGKLNDVAVVKTTKILKEVWIRKITLFYKMNVLLRLRAGK